MIPVVAALAAQGLSLVANAVLAKGKEFIEEKAGVKISPDMSPEELTKLQQFQLENERDLQAIYVEDNKLSEALAEKVIDAQIAEDKSVTDRWVADTTAGDMLTKRIRPGALIYLLALFTAMIVASGFGVTFGDGYFPLVKELLMLVFGAYFGGRSAEKIAEMYYNHKVEVGGQK